MGVGEESEAVLLSDADRRDCMSENVRVLGSTTSMWLRPYCPRYEVCGLSVERQTKLDQGRCYVNSMDIKINAQAIVGEGRVNPFGGY